MGMDVGSSSSGSMASPNVVPLIDILLVLIIIFMVITPLTPKGLDTLVPQPSPNQQQNQELENKTVVDPSNPIGFENGQLVRTLPADQSAASFVEALLPASARYVKAFGTLGADSLASAANRVPRRATLFYATDDEEAAGTVERLIRAAGFDPLKAGPSADAGRLEGPDGDLSQGGLNGEVVDLNQARAAIAARKVTA